MTASADVESVKEILFHALSLPSGAREEFVSLATADDAAVRVEVLSLLTECQDMDPNFLTPPQRAESLQARLRTSFLATATRAPDYSGVVVAERYTLAQRVGGGASGSVYDARVGVSGRRVAFKVLEHFPGGDPMWARREIAALRLLELPGVVRIIDDGEFEGRPYVVMDLVEGTPFPGCDTPAPWERVAGRVLALVEAVDRMHAHGVIHGDLKPANVLVTDGGAPVVVDLGLSSGAAVADWREAGGGLAGTRAYMAPERLTGHPPDALTDMYSLALMVAEVVLDLRPRSHSQRTQLVRRLELEPSDVPVAVRRALRSCLSLERTSRPETLHDVLTAISGGAKWSRLPELPGLPAPELVTHAVAEVSAGRSVTIRGESGAGKTTLLRQICERLPAQHPVHCLDVDVAPSVRAIEPTLALVVHGPADNVIARRTAKQLAELFVGPERLHWLRSVPAAELSSRTQGLCRSVVDELSSWVRAGCVRVRESRLVVDRLAFDRMIGYEDWDAIERNGALAPTTLGVQRAILEARRLVDAGAAHRARRLLSAVLASLRSLRDSRELETALVDSMLVACLLESTDRALDLALHELMRSKRLSSDANSIRLARAAQYALRRRGAAALALTDSADHLTDDGALVRVAVRQMACWSVPPAMQKSALAQAIRECADMPYPWVQTRLEEWRGWQSYREGRYLAAVRHHQRSTDSSTCLRERASAALNLASSQMELERFGESAVSARLALDTARSMRHSLHAARAEWIIRSSLYRSGSAHHCDYELLEAVESLGGPHTRASIQLNEAAIAWRAGDLELAGQLALEAATTWHRMDHTVTAALATGLAVACGADVDSASFQSALESAGHDRTLPAVSAQALQLLGRPRDAAAKLASVRRSRVARREILSDDEIGIP